MKFREKLDWINIGFVTGNGTTNSTNQYEFIDFNPPGGNVYYRLKQIDLDNSFNYSEILNFYNKFEDAVYLFPNPFKSNIQITLNQYLDANYTAQLFDITGKKIANINLDENTSLINLNHIDKGSYLLQVLDENEEVISTQKIIKQ